MPYINRITVIVFVLGFLLCESQANSQLIAAPTSVSTGVVPNSLVKIEEQCEGIIDSVPSGDWPKVSQDVATIVSMWAFYEPQAAKDGVGGAIQQTFKSTLTRLQTALTSKDATGTMQAANDLSAVVMDLFDVYHPTVPTDIGRLDVLERQIGLDMGLSNFTAATISLAKVNTVWHRVKPSVLANNGTDIAAKFEASLVAQGSALKARDAKALTAENKNGLEIVDALEKLY